MVASKNNVSQSLHSDGINRLLSLIDGSQTTIATFENVILNILNFAWKTSRMATIFI